MSVLEIKNWRVLAGLALAICGALGLTGCVSPNRFELRQISPGIFAGCKPTTPAQFALLRSAGVHTILSLQMFGWDISSERQMAKEHGLAYKNVPILASPLPPNEEQVKEALLTLGDPSLHPIYLHCLLGEDRAMMIMGLYRIYYDDWTPEAAWQEMIHNGFHVRWSLRGFETYFWEHTRKPEWAKCDACSTELRNKAEALRRAHRPQMAK